MAHHEERRSWDIFGVYFGKNIPPPLVVTVSRDHPSNDRLCGWILHQFSTQWPSTCTVIIGDTFSATCGVPDWDRIAQTLLHSYIKAFSKL